MAFLRPEKEMRDLVYRVLTTEPLVMVLPGDHRLAALKAISPRDIVGETLGAAAGSRFRQVAAEPVQFQSLRQPQMRPAKRG